MGYTLGSLLLVAFCELIALPLGIGAAIYLSEYASQNKITAFVRLFIEILAGVPSIVIGLVALGVLLGTLHWTNYLVTGALALSFMILPWNIRVSEEAIKSVPASYREASFALGATKWQTVRKAVLFAAIPGIITGILLGVGAAFGETAIVLLAAGDPPSGPNTLPAVVHLFGQYSGPIPCLTTFIYRAPTLLAFNAGSTRPDAVFNIYSVASAAGFILVMIYFGVCIIGLLARNYFNKKITGK
jgi:phosphate ABC transporter permease subunit PstA